MNLGRGQGRDLCARQLGRAVMRARSRRPPLLRPSTNRPLLSTLWDGVYRHDPAAAAVEGRASRAGRRGLYHTCQVTDRAIVIPENGGCTMKVHDEVCGMNIDSESAAASFELQGKTYFFCSERCRRKFEEHPDWYVPVAKDEHDGRT